MTMAVAWKTVFLITALMNKHLRFIDSGQCQRECTSTVRCIICNYLAKLPSAPQRQILTGETPVCGRKLYLRCRYPSDSKLYKNKKEPRTNSLTQSRYCCSLQERSSTEIAKLD